jgi:hypothetical protein
MEREMAGSMQILASEKIDGIWFAIKRVGVNTRARFFYRIDYTVNGKKTTQAKFDLRREQAIERTTFKAA